MTNPAGDGGAPGTGDNNGTGNTKPDDAGKTTSGGTGSGGQPNQPKPATGDGIDWKSKAEEYAADVEKWKGLSRKHEDRAKENADAASKTKTVEEQLAEMRKSLTERDARDLERSRAHALDKVHARLAEAGMRREDVSGLLELVDANSLLTEGNPDDSAVRKLADSLAKVAGRATPDPDQGRGGGGGGPMDMNSLIRRAISRNT